MTMTLRTLAAITLLLAFTLSLSAQNNYVRIPAGASPAAIVDAAASVTPSLRQYEWQRMELTAFIHFGINTFDEVEWGKRTTDITQFNPSALDATQWVSELKRAGFKLVILTCKHHDGFALWPSTFSDYTVARTPFRGGTGDVVREVSDACRAAGLKFGVYLSPWDMHEKSYGTPEYNVHFMDQLTELLTNYGPIAEVWFDGANGEGPNGRKQVYDWQSYYRLIRKLQPDAVIAVSGPDIRWVGTESGYGRATEWSVLPGASADENAVAQNSQQQMLDKAFVPKDLMEEDLGSREKLRTASSLIWYPAEIDVSIRPRWFYQRGDDALVKTPEKLFDIYFNSVGMNGVLLLNVPPDKRGLLHENDIAALRGFRTLLDRTFSENIVASAVVTASSSARGISSQAIVDRKETTVWRSAPGVSTASLEFSVQKARTVNCAMLQEDIRTGQRIEHWRIDAKMNGAWQTVTRGTTVGYKRLVRFPDLTASKFRIVIEQSRKEPTLASFGLFETPPEVRFISSAGAFADSLAVELAASAPDAAIHYTTDGTLPTASSPRYVAPIVLRSTQTVTAIAVSKTGKEGVSASHTYYRAHHAIAYRSSFSEKYSGAGPLTLVDGAMGSDNFNDGRWQGFNGTDLDVVIDLGTVRPVKKVTATFLRDIASFLFLPDSLSIAVSSDNVMFRSAGSVKNSVEQNVKTPFVSAMTVNADGTAARYVRVTAKNIGVCPAWHKGAGENAWLFCDEITVE